MIFTNTQAFGGNFEETLLNNIKNSQHVRIASGYTSLPTLQKFDDEFRRISHAGGHVAILIGMAFYEGLAKSTLQHLQDLSSELRHYRKDSGVFVPYSRKFHGKVYHFAQSTNKNSYFVGSSNFSCSGTKHNIECTNEITPEQQRKDLHKFLDYLFSGATSVEITRAKVAEKGSQAYVQTLRIKKLGDLKTYDPATVDRSKLSFFDFDLRRIANKESSNLNCYFGKGRLNKKSGRIAPRAWYEIELIADKDTRNSPLYPRGDFEAYTDDGFIIPMKTQGASCKNIRSRKSLQILGEWLKGKLQRSASLSPLQQFNEETLDVHGNSVLRFYRVSDQKYFLEFH